MINHQVGAFAIIAPLVNSMQYTLIVVYGEGGA
jgi:hypothetical protein